MAISPKGPLFHLTSMLLVSLDISESSNSPYVFIVGKSNSRKQPNNKNQCKVTENKKPFQNIYYESMGPTVEGDKIDYLLKKQSVFYYKGHLKEIITQEPAWDS